MSQTAHSLRRGLRKKELNDGELRDIMSDLMCYVRLGHILPLDSEVLTNAAKRGLISTLPPYMLGEDSGMPYVRGISSWLREKCPGMFVRPRYFTPYVEEAKTYLEERLGRPGEMIPPVNRSTRQNMSQIPDTLYMVDKPNSGVPMSEMNFNLRGSDSYQNCYEEISEQHGNNLAGQVAISLPVIEQRILCLMKQREIELKSIALSHRVLSVVPNRSEITRLIQLRVIREFGLPDAASDVLHSTGNYIPYPSTETTTNSDELNSSYGATGMIPSSGVLSNLGSNGALASDKDYNFAGDVRLETQSPVTAMAPSESYYSYDSEVS